MYKEFGGRVKIETIDRKTRKVIDTYGPDFNMVVDEGVGQFWRRLTTLDTGNATAFNAIALGVDYGDPSMWSEFNPEPPNRSLKAEDQATIYFTPFANMSFEFPVDNVIKVVGLVDGVEAMTQSFPTVQSAVFTSATLRFGNGRVFAYKRFPARYISRDVDIRIVWTITMQNASTYCGYREPVDDGLTFTYIAGQADVIKVDLDGNKLQVFNNHQTPVLGLAADIAGFVYSGSANGTLIKQDSNGNVLWQNLLNSGSPITSVLYDPMGNVYCAAENGFIRKITEYGSQLWAFDSTQQFIKLTGIDEDYNVYFVNKQNGDITKLTPGGSVEWTDDTTQPSGIIDAATSKTGMTVTVDSSGVMRAYNAIGDFLWDRTLGDTPRAVSFDPNGFIIVGFASTRLDKYNLASDQIWTFTPLDAWTDFLSVDNDGTIYVAMNNKKVRKVDAGGTQSWTFEDITDPISALTVNRN